MLTTRIIKTKNMLSIVSILAFLPLAYAGDAAAYCDILNGREGAPYTGLKPGEAVDPAVTVADKSLENGSVDKLITILTSTMANGIQERFALAYENQEHADSTYSVAAGRGFVESHVTFTHCSGRATRFKQARGRPLRLSRVLISRAIL